MRIFNLESNDNSIKVVAKNEDNMVDAFKLRIKAGEWLLNEHKLKDWKFEFDANLPMATVGLCNYAKKTIYINPFNLYFMEWETVKVVLLHEIAHALTPIGVGHGKDWQDKCRELGIQPCEKLNRSSKKVDEEKYQWEVY